MTFEIGHKINVGRKFTTSHRLNLSIAQTGIRKPNSGKGKKTLKHKINLSKALLNKNPSYNGIHAWVRKWKGKPKKCSKCKAANKRIEWANKDHKYRRNLNDYIELCTKCHRKYDKENNRKVKP